MNMDQHMDAAEELILSSLMAYASDDDGCDSQAPSFPPNRARRADRALEGGQQQGTSRCNGGTGADAKGAGAAVAGKLSELAISKQAAPVDSESVRIIPPPCAFLAKAPYK